MAQEDVMRQKELRERNLEVLHRACEESLEGLPLEFYEEVCSKAGNAGHFDVPSYGHILEAVASCVNTLLRENTELQDACRSMDTELMDAESSSSHQPTRRWRRTPAARPGARPAPELHREVFAMHQEVANSKEEVRQLMILKEVERETQEARVRKSRSEVNEMQCQMDEMMAAHSQEMRCLKEELQKIKSSKSDVSINHLSHESHASTFSWMPNKQGDPGSAGLPASDLESLLDARCSPIEEQSDQSERSDDTGTFGRSLESEGQRSEKSNMDTLSLKKAGRFRWIEVDVRYGSSHVDFENDFELIGRNIARSHQYVLVTSYVL